MLEYSIIVFVFEVMDLIGLNYPFADHVRRGNCATTYTDS